MMADDAEIDEEIERQLEADAHDRNYLEQPLLDEKEFDVNSPNEQRKKFISSLLLFFSFSFSMTKIFVYFL